MKDSAMIRLENAALSHRIAALCPMRHIPLGVFVLDLFLCLEDSVKAEAKEL